MADFQLDGVLNLDNVNINPAVFSKISRSVAGLPTALKQTTTQLTNANTITGNLNRSTMQTAQNMSLISRGARTFLQRMAQFAVLLPTFATLNRSIQGGAKFLVEFETQLANIVRIDTQGLVNRTKEIADRAFDIGVAYGASADQVIDSIRVFKQAGFTIEESFNKAEAATLGASVTTLTLADAQEALIAVTQQFVGLVSSDTAVIDKFAKVEDEAAVGAKDLADALKTGGNALAFATKSFDDTLGLIAALREQTRKSGREVGTFFKTLATRITAAGESRTAVELLGVQVENLDGSLRPLLDILNDLKVSFDGLTDAQQANAAKAIAGVRQFEGLLGTLGNLNRANELSGITAKSAGTAIGKQAIVANTLAFQLKSATAEFQKFAISVGEAGVLDIFKDALGTVKELTSAIGGFINLAGGLGVALGPLAVVGGLKAGQTIFGGRSPLGGGGGGGLGGGGSTQIIANKQLQAALQATTASVNQLGSASKQNSVLISLANSKQVAVSQVVAQLTSRQAQQAQVTQTATQKLIRWATTLDTSTGKVGNFSNESARSAVKVALFAAGTATLTQITNGLSSSLKNFGNTQAAAGVELAGSAAQMGVSFGLLSAKAGVVAGSLTAIVGASATIIKAIKERNSDTGQIENNDTINKQVAEFNKLVGSNGLLTNEVTLAFSKGVEGGSQNFRKIFFAELEKGVGKETGLGLLRGEELGKTFNTDFVRAFAQARGFEEVIRIMDQAVTDGTSPLAAGIGALIDEFGGFKDIAKLTKEETMQLARTQLLTKSSAFELADSLARAGLEIEKFNQSVIDAETSRSGPDRGLGDSSLSDANRSFQQSVEAVKISIQEYNRVAQNMIANNDELAKAGLSSTEELTKFIAKIDDASKKTGRLEVSAALEELRQEFPSVSKTAFESIVKARLEIQKALADQAKAELGLEKTKAKIVFDNAQASRQYLEEERSKIEDVRQEFNKLGLTLDATAEDIAAALSSSDLDKAKAELSNTISSSANNLSMLSKELSDLDASLSKLNSTGGTIDFESGLRKEEVERRRASTILELQISRIKAVADEGRKLAQVQKEEAKAQEEARKQSERMMDAATKLNDTVRSASIALEDITKGFQDFITESQTELLNEEASARSKLADAQGGVIDSSKSLADQFANFEAAIIAFNDAIADAKIESNLLGRDIGILTGGISTFQGRLSSLNSSFNDVLRNSNISLEQRIELERQLAEETLSFLQQARSEITSAGLGVFGQSAEENNALREGIAGLGDIANRLGGSFENFLNISDTGFNALSNEILSLPLELRQKILNALQTLPSTVDVGGFSVDQLKEAIGAVGAGVAPESGLPSLEALTDLQVQQLEKLQNTALRSAELEISQVKIASDQLAAAEEQLEVSKLQRDRAEQDLGSVRQSVMEQNTLLMEGLSLQQELTEKIIRADSDSAIRMITDSAREFASTRSNQSEVGQRIVEAITKLGESQRASLEALNSFNSTIQPNFRGYIPNFARGNITPREAAGLLHAAQREKRAMPAGAGLAVANTSEAIIPMRNKGFIPNYAGGSEIAAGISAAQNINETVVAAIARSVTQALSSLGSTGESSEELRRIQSILEDSNSKLDDVIAGNSLINTTLDSQSSTSTTTTTPSTQNIDITLTTQQNGTLAVTGLENLRNELTVAVRQATDERVNEALVPIIETLEGIFQTLRERNLLSSFGQAQ